MGSRARPSSPARAPSPARVEEALDRTVAAELPRLLPRQRWFGSKGRAIAAVRAADWARLGERGWLGLVDVAFGAGADERYLVAFVLRAGAAPGAGRPLRVGWPHVPPVAGAIEYVRAAGPAATLAILQRDVPPHGGGWDWALEQPRGLRDVVITTRAQHVPIDASRLGAFV